MPGFLLDTNTISELVRPAPDPHVTDWLRGQAPEALFISVVTMGELVRGLFLLVPSRRRERLREWIEDDLRTQFAGRILSFDLQAAAAWGRLLGEAERQGRRRSGYDAQIAATALCHGLTVATRNVRDFEGMGVALVNPWQGR